MNPKSLSSLTLLLSASALGACTTLGPMPATTGLVAPAAGRPNVEAQVGAVPGFVLSQTTQEEAKGAPIAEASGMLEPGRWIGIPGLGAGARMASVGDDQNVEPMLRYRGSLLEGDAMTGVAVAYGTYATGAEQSADYRLARGGLELGIDARFTPRSVWAEAHVFVSTSLTGLSGNGHYCLDANGRYGADCTTYSPNQLDWEPVAATIRGFYPALTSGIAVDFGRHLESVFHGGRLAVMMSGGSQPTLVGGAQQDARPFIAGGLTLTLAAGAL